MVQSRKRILHSLRAIFERSDGRKLHFERVEKSQTLNKIAQAQGHPIIPRPILFCVLFVDLPLHSHSPFDFDSVFSYTVFEPVQAASCSAVA